VTNDGRKRLNVCENRSIHKVVILMMMDPISETKFLMKEGNSQKEICNIQCLGGKE
jgi:hypothetical protein